MLELGLVGKVYGFFNKVKVRIIKRRILMVRAVKTEIEYLKKFIGKLTKPIYLFPIKLVTFTAYYIVKLLVRIILFVLKVIWNTVRWPFRKWSNFFKTIFWLVIFSYLSLLTVTMLIVMSDNYGTFKKFFCLPSFRTKEVAGKVVRIVGFYGEGSGFFIQSNQVLTNFHVIDGETNPKVILSDGSIVTVEKMTGDKTADLALIYTKEKYPDYVLPLITPGLTDNEPLFSIGYPLGTFIKGGATVTKGKFKEYRSLQYLPSTYIQTDISIAEGMSGGPLIESCGEVVGINELGVAGLSMFIGSNSIMEKIPGFTDMDIKKVTLDAAKSPQDAVFAFYTYISTRNMEEGFKLLSVKYLEKTNFQEWTARFKNILNVGIISTTEEPGKKDTVHVKFTTDTWDNQEVTTRYYEGTWQTIQEGGVYKMLKSNIKEVIEPEWDWFY